MDNDELRAIATKRIKAKRDFVSFLLIWLAVSVIVTLVYVLTNLGGYFWPGWVIGGMGIAALFQGISVYGPNRGVISESEIDAEVRKMGGNGPTS